MMACNILGDSDESIPDIITDKIFIGNMTHASNKEKLQQLEITSILICASYIEPNFPNVKKKHFSFNFEIII